MDDRKPQFLGDVLDRFLRQVEPDLAVESRVRAIFSEVVGQIVADHARPDRVIGSTLWLEVKSQSWAQELAFMSEDICRKLCERVGENAIAEIRFRVRSP